MKRTQWERRQDKSDEVKRAEAAGEIADSKEVRLALMKRVYAGEITLEEAQAELARIKRSAKAQGKTTRSRAWRRG